MSQENVGLIRRAIEAYGRAGAIASVGLMVWMKLRTRG
jgi:hypothetical protein